MIKPHSKRNHVRTEARVNRTVLNRAREVCDSEGFNWSEFVEFALKLAIQDIETQAEPTEPREAGSSLGDLIDKELDDE